MTDITIRNLDEGALSALTEQASASGVSREALVKQILAQYVRQIGTPRKGFKGYADNGAEVTIRNNGDDATATGKSMTGEQSDALKRAGLMCQAKNGGQWREARRILEGVGFTVYEI